MPKIWTTIISWDLLYHCNFNMVKLLVDSGFDIHDKNDDSFVLACFYGYMDIIIYLILKGANIGADDYKGIKLAIKKIMLML